MNIPVTTRQPRDVLGTYVMPVAAQGYPAGTELRNVTLRTARVLMECNRCGDCCDTRRPDVNKDEATGLPMFTWESADAAAGPGSQTADPHRYDDRLDPPQRLILPVVEVEGQLVVGDEFDRDAEGRPWTSYACAAFVEFPEGPDGPEGGCSIYGGEDGRHGRRPLNCGSFPVFGLEVVDTIVQHGAYVPPTGHLPRCTWHGIRVVGPWKE